MAAGGDEPVPGLPHSQFGTEYAVHPSGQGTVRARNAVPGRARKEGGHHEHGYVRGAGVSTYGPGPSPFDLVCGEQAYEVKYTPNGARRLRNEIAHLSHIRARLADEDHTSWTNLQILCGAN